MPQPESPSRDVLVPGPSADIASTPDTRGCRLEAGDSDPGARLLNEPTAPVEGSLERALDELQSLNERLIRANEQLQTQLQSLQRSNHQLHQLLVSSNLALVLLDHDGAVRHYTPAARELLDLGPDNIGHTLSQSVWRFTDSALSEEIRRVLGGEAGIEREVAAESGRWYSCTLAPCRNPEGAAEGIAITFTDITERRAAEQRVIESERQLKRITNAVPGMISYVDTAGRYRFNNAAYEVWFRRSPADLAGLEVREVLGPELYEIAEPYVEAALQGECVSYELSVPDTPLGARTLRADYIPDFDASSGEVKGFVALITDVTEMRQHEREIQSLNNRLREQVEEQEALFEAAPVGLFVARDARCENMTMNSAGARLLRLDVTDNPSLTGPHAERLPYRVYQGERSLEGEQLPIQRAMREGRQINNEEIEVRFENGESRLLSVHAAPLYEDGEVRGCVGVLVDSTDYRRVIEALAEADRRKNRFLAQLAHELRNPLTPLVIAADLLEREGDSPEVIQPVRKALVGQTRHLCRLVDDLLDGARIVLDRLELRREALDLRSALRDAVATVEAEVRAGDLQLQVSLPERPLPLLGDPTRLAQVFSNLLKNAVSYTPEGGCICLTAQHDGDQLVVQVEDTGNGLDPDSLERIFEALERSDRSAAHGGGLGLGLPIARRIAEMHGGNVTAFSAGPDHGSCFTVTLPASEPTPQPTPARSQRDEDAVALRVLLVEDQPDVAEAMLLLLGRLGHSCETVAHPDAVLPAVRSFRPQVVLLDIGLPDRSGVQVAAELAELDERHTMRVIALSGYVEDAATPEVSALFDGRLLKPVRGERLAAELHGPLQRAT